MIRWLTSHLRPWTPSYTGKPVTGAGLKLTFPWPDPTMKFLAAKTKVLNRGVPPDTFLQELVAWAKTAPVEIFAPNNHYDIYSSLSKSLGPYYNLRHRRAIMCEALRVLGGFESSWNWNEGRDSTNPNVDKPENEEAGIFQTSYDSVSFDPSLRACMKRFGVMGAKQFITKSKSNHLFAFEYTARLLRFTTQHHGPIKRHEIDRWVSREAVKEFEKALK